MVTAINQRESNADLIVELTGVALSAPDVPTAVTPILERLVSRTAAVGSAYFQLTPGADGAYFARAASGKMPTGPAMEQILHHGLPENTPLLEALRSSPGPLFFDDTSLTPETAGFPDLGAFLMHTFDHREWTKTEADLFAAISDTLASLAARLVAKEEAVSARERAVHALGLALEHRDRETKGHTDRVTTLSAQLGVAVGMTTTELDALRWGAYLHDIGKIGIPDAVLLKPDRLDAAEWELMKTHSSVDHRFAAALEFPPAAETLAVIRSHHERWAGTGYPDGLAGNAIPLGARIFTVADDYDALTNARPYKRAWCHAEAVAEIRSQSGARFDPRVVVAFLSLMETRA